MPGGALAVRVVRMVMRVCMRAASAARKGVSRNASTAAWSRDGGEARDRRRQAVDAPRAHGDLLADGERVGALLREGARGVEQPAAAVGTLAIGRRGHRARHGHSHAQALGRARELQLFHDAAADEGEVLRRPCRS
jgi:hypothetical protein